METEFDLSKFDDGILSELPEGWREIATGIFKEGGHIKNVMIALGISKKKHEEYMSEEAYSDIMDNGMILSEAWWLDWGKKNINDKTANVPLFNSMMNAMFNWGESKAPKKEKPKDDESKGKKLSGYIDKYDKTQKNNKEQVQ